MRKSVLVLFVMVFCLALATGNALALGMNITIFDNRPGNGGAGVGLEDQETEPGMINNQSWDLEGFFLNNSILTMAGGYDFKVGCWGVQSGDIFIDIDEDTWFDHCLQCGYIKLRLKEVCPQCGFGMFLDSDVGNKFYRCSHCGNTFELHRANK